MERFERSVRLPVSAAEAWAWHARAGAFERLVPPWERVEVVSRSGGLEEGSRVVLRMRRGPLALRWEAVHRDVRPGRSFDDIQEKGPFRHWRHRHELEPDAGGGCVLTDRIDFALPGGRLGRALAGEKVRADLERTFRYRHAVTRGDLELHRRLAGRPRLRIGLTDRRGFLAPALAALLTTGGHEVVDLTPGDLAPARSAPPLDAVLHPCGRALGLDPATVGGASEWAARCAELDPPVRLVVLAGWPEAAIPVGLPGAEPGGGAGRAGGAVLHFAPVLTPAGGILRRLLPAFRLGLGGAPRASDAPLRWVSLDDAIAAVLYLILEPPPVGGVHSVAAPQEVGGRELADALGAVLGRRVRSDLSPAAARRRFGRTGARLLGEGTGSLPPAPPELDLPWRHRRLADALEHLFGRTPG